MKMNKNRYHGDVYNVHADDNLVHFITGIKVMERMLKKLKDDDDDDEPCVHIADLIVNGLSFYLATFRH